MGGGREDRGGGAGGVFGLHPIPSVIDLPTTNAGVGFEVGWSGSVVDGVGVSRGDLKMRVGGGGGAGNGVVVDDEKIRNGNGYDKESVGKDGQVSDVKHYDADGKWFFSLTIKQATDNHVFFLLFFSVNQSYCICGYSCFSY